jgi:hypothetical protein
MVAVAVPYTETALREKLKGAGGRWNQEERVWICFGAIRGDTALVERIMREQAAGRGIVRTDRTGSAGIRSTSHLYRLPDLAIESERSHIYR